MAATSNGSDADSAKGFLPSSSILMRIISGKGRPATTDEKLNGEKAQEAARPWATKKGRDDTGLTFEMFVEKNRTATPKDNMVIFSNDAMPFTQLEIVLP